LDADIIPERLLSGWRLGHPGGSESLHDLGGDLIKTKIKPKMSKKTNKIVDNLRDLVTYSIVSI
jgi:hypothetical protein